MKTTKFVKFTQCALVTAALWSLLANSSAQESKIVTSGAENIAEQKRTEKNGHDEKTSKKQKMSQEERQKLRQQVRDAAQTLNQKN